MKKSNIFKDYDHKKHNFQPIIRQVKFFFGENLDSIFVHGSLFDGTFGDYSDYDIVIILKSLESDVLFRDQFAQNLKKSLIDKWSKNPYTFDFYTRRELMKSSKEGHPFVKSILTKGCPVYDPGNLFEVCLKNLNPNLTSKSHLKMAGNLQYLSQKYIEVAQKLQNIKETQFAIMQSSMAITLLARSQLIKDGHNIYQGEIYQFFIKYFEKKLSRNLIQKMWKYAFPANQMAFRLKEPHVDVPLQDTKTIYKNIKNEDLVKQLISLYNELKLIIE